MHIYVAGGTGRNGALIIQEALQKGHSVTALVRNTSTTALPPHKNLTVVQGTPVSQSDVQRALQTPEFPSAIITALRGGHVTDSPLSPLRPDSPPDFLASTMQTLVHAIHAIQPASPPKIIVNSTFGTGSSWGGMALPFRLIFRYTAMRQSTLDHDAMDAVVRESGLPFVLARPCRLVDGIVDKDVLDFPDNGDGASWNPTISRASLCRWLVEAAETQRWDGKSPVLTN